ncbi:molybdate ABC transporter substrate-binding protein [Halpernia frigidisoli]|uniref:Molybdate transport system substrate-binding protein n=1 Tax=Halpernia frigidisoli TaxID=1125876 RepID=A0A1I3E5F6_9FLAO|nr:molybdate ABC transporter substrate-binding protein [Halpernia frigidisoli]SFH94175.1 molybdate transport system substrate-binding protein [Halpernia frigidisoli]
MKKLLPLFLAVFFVIFSCKEKETKKLNIAVAANMQFAMKDLIKKFTEISGIQCETNVGSSGKLTAQIQQNAPVDIFISADMKYPEELYKAGFTIKKPEIYAYGKLVMWSINKDVKPSFDILTTDKIKHIAVANPKLAPYGKATVEVLEKMKLYDVIKNKLVFGESISQTNQFIISRAAEIGFTAKSVVLSPEMKGKGSWIDVNESDYSPIAQGVVVIKHKNAENADAQKFYDFLFSPDANKIMVNYGYK